MVQALFDVAVEQADRCHTFWMWCGEPATAAAKKKENKLRNAKCRCGNRRSLALGRLNSSGNLTRWGLG